jgi:hypothetical protein
VSIELNHHSAHRAIPILTPSFNHPRPSPVVEPNMNPTQRTSIFSANLLLSTRLS